MSALAARVEAARPTLVAEVVRASYLDPFWEARFGARGRSRTEEDIGYHVSYLVEALASADAEVFARYASWLRTVLVSRGMCTRHLGESFERLARAIEAHVVDHADAIAILDRGRGALAYDSGLSGELDRLAPEIAARSELDVRADVLVVASYVADTLAEGRDTLAAHLVFVDGLPPGDAPSRTARAIHFFRAEVHARGSADLAQAVAALFTRAVGASIP